MFNKKLLQEIKRTTGLINSKIDEKGVDLMKMIELLSLLVSRNRDNSLCLEEFKKSMETRLMSLQEVWKVHLDNNLKSHLTHLTFIKSQLDHLRILLTNRLPLNSARSKIPKKRGRPAKNKKG
jgi:hypothetical protein